jgi:hypothetical protein
VFMKHGDNYPNLVVHVEFVLKKIKISEALKVALVVAHKILLQLLELVHERGPDPLQSLQTLLVPLELRLLALYLCVREVEVSSLIYSRTVAGHLSVEALFVRLQVSALLLRALDVVFESKHQFPRTPVETPEAERITSLNNTMGAPSAANRAYFSTY